MNEDRKKELNQIDEIAMHAKNATKKGRYGLLFFDVEELDDGTMPRVAWIRGRNMTKEEFDGFIRRIQADATLPAIKDNNGNEDKSLDYVH